MAHADSSVFSKLYSLISQRQDSGRNCEEDFLTEIIASVLSLNDNAGRFFSYLLGIPDDQYSVSTQEVREKLDRHDDASRIDMVASGEKTMIFVENKIASSEGTDATGEHDQLEKYADHLARESQDKKILLYITKWADPKNEMDAYCRAKGSEFHQRRWFEVYQALQQLVKNTGPDPIIQQTLKFMENQKHTPKRNFSPVDIMAIQHWREAESMLKDSVSEKFRKEVRRITSIDPKDSDWKDNGSCCFAELEGCILGVCFPLHADKDYPAVNIWVEYSSAEKNHVVENEMKAFADASHKEWEFNEWSRGKKRYICVQCEKPLSCFLINPDHVAAIEKHLLEKLVQLEPVWKLVSEQSGNALPGGQAVTRN